MKTILVLSLFLATLIQSRAQGFGQTNPSASTAAASASQPSAGKDARERFAAGLLSEEGEGDLAAAAAAYRQTIQAFDRQRDEAANAIFRLGEVYRKMGRLEEAKVQYARILREFPDMVRLTEISHNLLFGEEGNRTAGFDWFLGGTHAGTVGIRGGGGVGGGLLGSGGMGGGGMPGEGAAATNVTDEGTGYVDHEMSALYGTTVLRAQRSGPKPEAAEPGAGAAPDGTGTGDPRASERIMMQRYGITGSSAVRESSAPEAANRLTCMNNLKQLGLAARIYATDHNGAFPREAGLLSNEIHVTKVLVCPSDTSHEPAASWDEFRAPLHMTYEYAGALAWVDQPQAVLFRCPIHGHVALGDGSVQQGRTQQSAVTPQSNEMLRRRYALGKPSEAMAQRYGLDLVAEPAGFELEPATITLASDGTLQLYDGKYDLDQLTAKLKKLPAELRTTPMSIHADKEVKIRRIVEVLDVCEEAGMTRVVIGADAAPIVVQELERLNAEAQSLQREADLNSQTLGRIPIEQSGLESELQQAKTQQSRSRQRLDAARRFAAELLPAIVSQDERYQRLKSEYEAAVVSGDEPERVRTRARLNSWVENIYRPELEAEVELADLQFSGILQSSNELEQRRKSLKVQAQEKGSQLQNVNKRIGQLQSLLDRTQEDQRAEGR
jgi:hypothetical protein